MKILLVSGPGISLKEPYSSGIEAFIVSFANQLVEQGHVVDVVAQEAGADAGFMLINPFRSGETYAQDFQNLDVDAYDIIHYNMFYPELIRAAETPSVLTLHSPADERRLRAYRDVAGRADLTFVAISERVKRQWDEALNIDIPLINNGIDMNLWPVKRSTDNQYLLWSARINAEKNVAAAIFLAQHMQLPLKIAGRIVDQHYFDTQVEPHLSDQIQYVGHLTQRELSDLAQQASAYLATATWQEPFGLAALEMLASGVPVVGFQTAIPPNWRHESVLTTASNRWQDLVGLVEKTALVSPKTCKAFASGMDIQNMTSNYIKLYEALLSHKAVEAI